MFFFEATASILPCMHFVQSLTLFWQLSHVDGVKGYAHPRFWPKDAETMIGSITVLLSRSSHDETALQVPIADVVRNVEESLRRRIPSLHEVAIQVE